MDQLIHWWNHLPENISPVLIQFGKFQIRYYGLMYLTSFLVFYALVLDRLKKEKPRYSRDDIDNYFFWIILSVLVGSRLGYVIFYNLKYFLKHPLEIFLPFSVTEGIEFTGISGMSYHGGLIAVVLITWLFCLKYKFKFWAFVDFIVPAVPLGYMFGRLGNFLNGELYGRVTNVAWGMYFPQASTYQLRHPSQLYEAFFEGIVLFLLLWSLRKKKIFDGFLFALYLAGYGAVRFFIEYFREPDAHIGFVFGGMTVGQIFCLTMILGGVFIMLVKRKQKA